MRHKDRLSGGEVAGWGGLGFVTGFALGLALSAWAGDVNRARIDRATRRLRAPAPRSPISSGAAARDARAALDATPALRDLVIEVRAVSPRVVELRGWVDSRPLRALAARTVRAAAGVESVINSILVRGEDDRGIRESPRPDNQTA
ncbi:MAG TPA: BON domain-containing protein [Gemmatimonadales bacterium]|nr:BON domain-containing protein [Gemmatimonadales bacterium]